MSTQDFERNVVFQLQRLGEIQEANTARLHNTVEEVRQLRTLVQEATRQVEASIEALKQIGGTHG